MDGFSVYFLYRNKVAVLGNQVKVIIGRLIQNRTMNFKKKEVYVADLAVSVDGNSQNRMLSIHTYSIQTAAIILQTERTIEWIFR